MVKQRKKNSRGKPISKKFKKNRARAIKINASTGFDTALMTVMSVLRERVWKQLDLYYGQIAISIDTTVETLYGRQQGGRKGHNTKNRGKKGYRPVLAFIDQTREYIAGKLRVGETLSGQETADFIYEIKNQLPGCVQDVLPRADGEFCSWEAVAAAKTCGFRFIIANPVTFHKYLYGKNNPVMYVDPSGRFFSMAMGSIALHGILSQTSVQMNTTSSLVVFIFTDTHNFYIRIT